MQIIGTLYAIFIAVAILGIQASLTILSSKNSQNPLMDEDSIKKFLAPIGNFQIVHRILAYFVFLVEFSCGAYIHLKSDPTSFVLLILYALFILAIVYIIIISYYLIDYLLSPITGKDVEFNFDVFGCIGKWDFLKVTSFFACFFITICIYPIVANKQDSTPIYPLIITILLGLVMYLIVMSGIRNNENQTISKQNDRTIQTEIGKLKDVNQK